MLTPAWKNAPREKRATLWNSTPWKMFFSPPPKFDEKVLRLLAGIPTSAGFRS